MAATITTPIGTTVTARYYNDVVTGLVVDIQPGACRGGGLANVKAVWPGRKRASLRLIELADLEVTA